MRRRDRWERLVQATWPNDWGLVHKLIAMILLLLFAPVVFGAQLIGSSVRWGHGIDLVVAETALGVVLMALPIGSLVSYLGTVIWLYKRNSNWRVERVQTRATHRRDEVVRRIMDRQ
jgi:hypothetical protein